MADTLTHLSSGRMGRTLPSFRLILATSVAAAAGAPLLLALTPGAPEAPRLVASAPKAELAATAPEAPSYPYYGQIQTISKKYEVAPELIAGIVRLESNFDRFCVSPVGAIGLMQLMPDTARDMAHELGWRHYNLYEPATNLELGTRFFKGLLRQYHGHIPSALSYYNAGRYGMVSRGVYRNRRYIRFVMDNYWDYLRTQGDAAAPTWGEGVTRRHP